MGVSLPKTPDSMQFNSIAPRMAKASIANNRPETSADFDPGSEAVSLVFETLAAVGMTDKEAAYTMGMDPAQLSRVKSGQGRLPFDAMWRLPDHFWKGLRDRIDEAKGISGDQRKRMRVARIAELVRLLVEEEVA